MADDEFGRMMEGIGPEDNERPEVEQAQSVYDEVALGEVIPQAAVPAPAERGAEDASSSRRSRPVPALVPGVCGRPMS